MLDEEFLFLLLTAFHILEQNRLLRLRRHFVPTAFLLRERNLRMQRAAIWHFANIFRNRRAWVYHRKKCEFEAYHERDVNVPLDPNYWRSHYRMSRQTFDFLCTTVHDFMVKGQYHMRETIPVPKRVAVSLWWLANGESYRSVGQKFGISSSIVGRITKDFVGALVPMRNTFITWLQTHEDFKESVNTFVDLSTLPNVFAAIDGTHVQIAAPEQSTVDFFDRKQRYSIGCQGICDGNMKFLSVSAGFPGSVHDSRMLRNTWIFQQAQNENILTAPLHDLGQNNTIRPYLVGDAAYPLSTRLMKPFPYSKNMDANQEIFNLALSQARVTIERAFGVLKGRWRILLGKVCLEPSFAADVVIACSVLHNICQKWNEPTDVEFIDPSNEGDNLLAEENERMHGSGERIRELLVNYVLDHENS